MMLSAATAARIAASASSPKASPTNARTGVAPLFTVRRMYAALSPQHTGDSATCHPHRRPCLRNRSATAAPFGEPSASCPTIEGMAPLRHAVLSLRMSCASLLEKGHRAFCRNTGSVLAKKRSSSVNVWCVATVLRVMDSAGRQPA